MKAKCISMEYAMWLRGISWKHFCSLTFRKEIGPRGAEHSFQLWVSSIKKLCPRIQWLKVNERTRATNRLHLHVLLAGTAEVTSGWLENKWRSIGGSCVIRPYEKENEGKGLGYLLKGITAEETLALDLHLNPRRSRRV